MSKPPVFDMAQTRQYVACPICRAFGRLFDQETKACVDCWRFTTLLQWAVREALTQKKENVYG